MHFGQERSLGPRPYQLRINKHLMSLGVHMIIGAHPHVLQPHCVTEDNKLMSYSLGNFLFYPNRPMGGPNPVGCSFSINYHANRTFSKRNYQFPWARSPRISRQSYKLVVSEIIIIYSCFSSYNSQQGYLSTSEKN